MSYRELFVSPSPVLAGYQQSFEEARYVVLGVPFDVTSTYRTGAKFAPLAIREASQNIEGYSFRTGVDIEDLKLHDLGDLHATGDVELTLGRLALVLQDLVDDEKLPVLLGGEHTITMGAMRSLKNDVAVVSFDAHLDTRDDYMGLTLSHTTFMRRINEDVKPPRILEVGTRAVCKEELEYVKKAGIEYLTAQEIRKEGAQNAADIIEDQLDGYKKVYVTIDMDVLDPAYAPAVQNPEPEGLDTSTLLDLLAVVCDNRVVGLDLVEVAPIYDSGVTAITAAKILCEALCNIEKSRKS